MSPFDLPPAGSPVSLPEPGADDPRRGRGRTALVALLAIGLVGGGIAGVSQLASADEPELSAAAPDDGDEGDAPAQPVDDGDETPAPPPVPEDEPVDIDGQIVIDTGDGDPVVIDLGDIEFGRLQECFGLPALPFDPDADLGEWSEWEPGTGPFGDLDELFGDEFFENLPAFDEFPMLDGGSVTVTGPDGTSIVDLGENGSVTITKDGDEIVVETDGDATVEQLDEMFGEFGTLFDEEFAGDLDVLLDDLLGEFDGGLLDELLGEGFPAVDEMPEFELFDAEGAEQCVDEALGR